MASDKAKVSEEQVTYASVLNVGMWLGFAVLCITFLIYVLRFAPSYVEIEKLPNYWGMKVGDYLYVMSEIEQGKGAEAAALVAVCKSAPAGQKPAECKEIGEKGHKMAGWSWLKRLGTGDYMNFIGVAILAGLTIVCYLSIFPALLRKKDMAYVVISIVEVLVLALAASGILRGGGH